MEAQLYSYFVRYRVLMTVGKIFEKIIEVLRQAGVTGQCWNCKVAVYLRAVDSTATTHS